MTNGFSVPTLPYALGLSATADGYPFVMKALNHVEQLRHQCSSRIHGAEIQGFGVDVPRRVLPPRGLFADRR